MDFLRSGNRILRMACVTNAKIQEIMRVTNTMIDTTEAKQLLLYGHTERMSDRRWPKIVLNKTRKASTKFGRCCDII